MLKETSEVVCDKAFRQEVLEACYAALIRAGFKRYRKNGIDRDLGNGVNSRALQSLRVIGAATFPDNPRNDDEIRENLYEYLGLPEFNTTVPSLIMPLLIL